MRVGRAVSGGEFSAVAQEVAQVLHLPMVGVYRYDSDGLMTVIATVERPVQRVLSAGNAPAAGRRGSMVAQVQP